MNYKKIYNSIISNAISKHRSKKDSYFENHHIKPKCIGGSDDKSNLVLLTAREHYICHKLLVKMYPYEYKLIFAWNYMANTNKNLITSKEYDKLKQSVSKLLSKIHKGKIISDDHKAAISKFWKGKPKPKPSEATRKKMSEAHKGQRPANYGVPHTKETRKKISEAGKGRIQSKETRKKMSIKQKERIRRKWTNEEKSKMSNIIKGSIPHNALFIYDGLIITAKELKSKLNLSKLNDIKQFNFKRVKRVKGKIKEY